MTAKRYNKIWEEGEIEKLIDLYEGNSFLCDIFDKNYQKRDMKEIALDTIAKDFDIQIADVKAKWNAIRGQFGRELNKVKVGRALMSYVSQIFWDKLQFLQSVMKTTKSRDTLPIGNDSLQNATLSSDEEVTENSTEDNTVNKQL